MTISETFEDQNRHVEPHQTAPGFVSTTSDRALRRVALQHPDTAEVSCAWWRRCRIGHWELRNERNPRSADSLIYYEL